MVFYPWNQEYSRKAYKILQDGASAYKRMSRMFSQ